MKIADAPIKAIAPWFGGKRSMAPLIVKQLGPHRSYWGLCCGSLAVEMAKPPATMETCIDLHGDLTNLCYVLQDTQKAPQLYGRLARMVLSRELFLDSAKLIRTQKPPVGEDEPCEDRAFHYMVVSWFGRNGVAGTSNYNAGFCARYKHNGGHAAKRFVSAVESIPGWHQRLRNLTVMRDDIFTHLPRIADQIGTAIYCDPPYIEKGAKYLHDFDGLHHHTLARELRRFEKARVVVSYYDHPEVNRFYAGWTKLDCSRTKAMANQGQRQRGAVKAPEVLLINGPAYESGSA
ncbi:MAG: DNA adenine methylase [Planctomycetota bacterium]